MRAWNRQLLIVARKRFAVSQASVLGLSFATDRVSAPFVGVCANAERLGRRSRYTKIGGIKPR